MSSCEGQLPLSFIFKGSSYTQTAFLLRANFLLCDLWQEAKKKKRKKGVPWRPEQGLSKTTPTLDFEL